MTTTVPTSTIISFAAGTRGAWAITDVAPVIGDSLPVAERLLVTERIAPDHPPIGAWDLRGAISNIRYTNRRELSELAAIQQGLGRPQATCAALIPIRKNPEWWALAQDERRQIIEEDSRHISLGMEYLPAIARRLHHCRELVQPFDFLTWFEYAPQDTGAFEELVARLRATREWRYVDREVDIRLTRI